MLIIKQPVNSYSINDLEWLDLDSNVVDFLKKNSSKYLFNKLLMQQEA